MKKISKILAVVLALSLAVSAAVFSAGAAVGPFLHVAVTDVVNVTPPDATDSGGGIFEIRTAYSNTEGLHLIDLGIDVSFNPQQIELIAVALPTAGTGGTVTMGNMEKGENLTAGPGLARLAYTGDTGLTAAEGPLLTFIIRLLSPGLNEIYFVIEINGAALEVGGGPEAVDLSGDQITFEDVSDGALSLRADSGHTHIAGDWEIIKDATCTEEGLQTKSCTICGIELESEPIEALGHDFGDWFVVSWPTPFAGGQEKRECARCDETETRVIPKLPYPYGHVSGGTALSVSDARMVLQYLVDKITLTQEQLLLANVSDTWNEDNTPKVTITNARLILQRLVDKIDKFPVE
ncbi:MAG: hypothetical protein FWE80_02160 [Oscillospiraceae bacterium]|nr:hypothetical protein [Oscillospiraceae bacterium]